MLCRIAEELDLPLDVLVGRTEINITGEEGAGQLVQRTSGIIGDGSMEEAS